MAAWACAHLLLLQSVAWEVTRWRWIEGVNRCGCLALHRFGYFWFRHNQVSNTMSFAIRSILLILFAIAGFLVYGNALGYFGEIIVVSDRPFIYGALLLQGFVAAALVSILLCFPLAKVFHKHSPLAALAISLPVLLLRIPEFLDPSRHVFALFISAYEVLAYVLLPVLGAWLAHKQLSPNPPYMDSPKMQRPDR